MRQFHKSNGDAKSTAASYQAGWCTYCGHSPVEHEPIGKFMNFLPFFGQTVRIGVPNHTVSDTVMPLSSSAEARASTVLHYSIVRL